MTYSDFNKMTLVDQINYIFYKKQVNEHCLDLVPNIMKNIKGEKYEDVTLVNTLLPDGNLIVFGAENFNKFTEHEIQFSKEMISAHCKRSVPSAKVLFTPMKEWVKEVFGGDLKEEGCDQDIDKHVVNTPKDLKSVLEAAFGCKVEVLDPTTCKEDFLKQVQERQKQEVEKQTTCSCNQPRARKQQETSKIHEWNMGKICDSLSQVFPQACVDFDVVSVVSANASEICVKFTIGLPIIVTLDTSYKVIDSTFVK